MLSAFILAAVSSPLGVEPLSHEIGRHVDSGTTSRGLSRWTKCPVITVAAANAGRGPDRYA